MVFFFACIQFGRLCCQKLEQDQPIVFFVCLFASFTLFQIKKKIEFPVLDVVLLSVCIVGFKYPQRGNILSTGTLQCAVCACHNCHILFWSYSRP